MLEIVRPILKEQTDEQIIKVLLNAEDIYENVVMEILKNEEIMKNIEMDNISSMPHLNDSTIRASYRKLFYFN